MNSAHAKLEGEQKGTTLIWQLLLHGQSSENQCVRFRVHENWNLLVSNLFKSISMNFT